MRLFTGYRIFTEHRLAMTEWFLWEVIGKAEKAPEIVEFEEIGKLFERWFKTILMPGVYYLIVDTGLFWTMLM